MITNFPTNSDLLDVFAAGMREQKDREAQRITVDVMNKLSLVSPFLRQPTHSYADFMAGRNQQKDA